MSKEAQTAYLAAKKALVDRPQAFIGMVSFVEETTIPRNIIDLGLGSIGVNQYVVGMNDQEVRQLYENLASYVEGAKLSDENKERAQRIFEAVGQIAHFRGLLPESPTTADE